MNFFAYGTLEFPAVMEAVTGHGGASVPALLRDYERFLLAGRPYPGIVARSGAETGGALYASLDPGAFELLDRFEDDCYERRRVEVEREDGAAVAAFAYVIPEPRRGVLSREPWLRDRFAASHFPGFLEHCRGFRRRAEAARTVEEGAASYRPGDGSEEAAASASRKRK